MVSVLGCQSRGSGFKSRPEIWFEMSAPPALIADSATMCTLTVHYQREGETVMEMTDHPSSYARG